MTVNDRYAYQSKNAPDLDDAERFFPMGAIGSGSYSLTAPPRDLLKLYSDVLYGHRSDTNLITLYHTIPEIYSAVDQIAKRVINADFQLRSISDGEIVTGFKPWEQLKEQSNPMQTFKELIYESIVYYLVTGKNYLYKNMPETLKAKFQNIGALWNLPADRVQPLYEYSVKLFSATEMKDIVKQYELFDGINTAQFATENVLHTKTLNLDWVDRRMRGKSPLLAADIAIAVLIAVYESENLIYTKRGALGAIVSKKEDASGPVALTPKEKNAVEIAHQQMYGLTGKRNPYMISAAPIEFVKFGDGIKELMPFETQRQCMAAIYSVLNVPFELAPKDESTTYDNLNNAGRMIYNNTVIPICTMFMEAVSKFLGLKDIGYFIFPDYSKIHELQDNKKEAAQVDSSATNTNTALFSKGIITLNQWQERQNLPLSTNQLYNKLVYDMTPEELVQVAAIMKLNAPTAPAPATGNLSTSDPTDTEDATANK